MKNIYEKVVQSAKFIQDKTNFNPKIAVILGSGLGDLVNVITHKQIIEYKDIPNFPQVTVHGHSGRMVFGTINGVEVMAMQGRFHYYEGYTMKQVAYPIYVMKMLGIEKLIVTNACGGINTSFQPGTLMIINDFINLVSDNPLIGVNDERFGPRFPDMTEPFKLALINKAKAIAKDLNIDYQEGVYAGFMGPYYETAAEIRAIAKMGADAVGMSTVPETIAANYLGLQVLGISCITNMATGIQKVKHSHERVVETAKKASIIFCKWVEQIIQEIN
ncbi:purine-nucleoside phosphorylase [Clostridium sp. 'deep sea']|nr:purine-nucleoside phosphorylase [Clostridium sp. 'deep sea']QOR35130.1 purine-nucleoside phosphorylase [Clostridium sp. 'deep sea']